MHEDPVKVVVEVIRELMDKTEQNGADIEACRKLLESINDRLYSLESIVDDLVGGYPTDPTPFGGAVSTQAAKAGVTPVYIAGVPGPLPRPLMDQLLQAVSGF